MRVEIQVHRGAAEDAERIFFYLAASHRQIRKSFLCAPRASAVKFLFCTRADRQLLQTLIKMEGMTETFG